MESNQPRVIYRYEQPSKLDTANHLTLCMLFTSQIYYIQMNQDSENPRWEYLGPCENEEILLKLINLLAKK